MKLYVRQKVFSWSNKFSVYDESGQICYSVEGEIFSWGHKLHVYDANGIEVALIKQEMFRFMPSYAVFSGEQMLFQIIKEFSFFHPRYSIVGMGWDVDGEFWAHDYRITCQGRQVADINKQWLTWGDCYELDVADHQDEVAALCVLLTIDCVLASNNN